MKLYYTIKEVAALVDEEVSTLRYWESEFSDIITPRRNEHGVRYYSDKDIGDVRLIHFLLRDNGLTIEGARKKLKTQMDVAVRNAKLINSLRNIRFELKGLEESFSKIIKNS